MWLVIFLPTLAMGALFPLLVPFTGLSATTVVIGLALVGALTVVFVSVALLKMLREDRARRRGAAR